MSDAIAAVGTQLKRGDGASAEAFTALAEVKNITGPGMTRELIDVTNLDSTGGYREFIAGFRDGGQLTFDMNFTLDAYDDLFADYGSDDSRNYQLVMPDTGNTTFEFAAFVMDLPPNMPTGEAVTVAVTMKITGEVTLSS